MGALRKLKRDAIRPKIKEAKKIADTLIKNDSVARQATLAQKNAITNQASARVNICAFWILHQHFKVSYDKMIELIKNLHLQNECMTTNEPGTHNPYLTFDMILQILKNDIKWEFPAYEIKPDKPRFEMSAAEMADYDAGVFYLESKGKLELMWCLILLDKAGFGIVRLKRFIGMVREMEQTLTLEEVRMVVDRYAKAGIELCEFVEHIEEIRKYNVKERVA